jgi:hypothetical protein
MVAWSTRVISCPTCKRLQKPADECSNPVCGAPIKGIKSPLAGLRFHDLRHHAITELAESQASDATVMSIAGHDRGGSALSVSSSSFTSLTCD